MNDDDDDDDDDDCFRMNERNICNEKDVHILLSQFLCCQKCFERINT